MPTEHKVEAGDTIARIAEKHGFRDWRRVFNHPGNAELRATRDPNALAPGDVVVVPDFEPRAFRRKTGESHEFVLGRRTHIFRLVLLDRDGNPYAGFRYELEVGGETKKGRFGNTGKIEFPVPVDAKEGTLRVFAEGSDDPIEVALEIGFLEPVDTDMGLRSRLANLGYLFDAAEASDEEVTLAIKKFCEEKGRPVESKDSGALRDALVDAHGI